jgi:hypothetical protein
VMRNSFALLERDFGCGDLDLFIDLYGVAVDDLAVELKGNFDSEGAFAGGCWTNDGYDWRFRGHAAILQPR